MNTMGGDTDLVWLAIQWAGPEVIFPVPVGRHMARIKSVWHGQHCRIEDRMKLGGYLGVRI